MIASAVGLRRAGASLIAGVALAAVPGCGSSGPASRTAGALPTPSTVAAAARGHAAAGPHRGGSPGAPTRPRAQLAPVRLPAAVVATVAGSPITLADYRAAYAAETHAMTAGGVSFDPPGFAHCAAGLGRAYAALTAKLRGPRAHTHIRRPPAPTHAALVKQCQARQQMIRQGALTQLIERRWYTLQAQSQGIVISAAVVSAAIARQRQALGGARAYARYLTRTGQTAVQAAAQVRLGLIEQRLSLQWLGGPVAVGEGQISAFFAAHRAEFEIPGDRRPQLSRYRARIRLLLIEQAQARRAAAARAAFQRRWRAETVCRGGYVVALCANAG